MIVRSIHASQCHVAQAITVASPCTAYMYVPVRERSSCRPLLTIAQRPLPEPSQWRSHTDDPHTWAAVLQSTLRTNCTLSVATTKLPSAERIYAPNRTVKATAWSKGAPYRQQRDFCCCAQSWHALASAILCARPSLNARLRWTPDHLPALMKVRPLIVFFSTLSFSGIARFSTCSQLFERRRMRVCSCDLVAWT